MEKARRPHVIRTMTVERTRVPYHEPGPMNFLPQPAKFTARPPRPKPGPAAEH
jgi:hypothetical protein